MNMSKAFSILALAAGLSSVAAFSKDIPNPAVDVPTSPGLKKAVFAGGCFWCTEAVFEEVVGVQKVVSGYAGGTKQSAHYEVVGSGRTEHAEAIEITYDPAKVSYGTLLKVFFAVAHDPTQLNRQGPDYGKQYRSEIFAQDPEQKKVAEAYMRQLTDAKVFSGAIATKLSEGHPFYPAEAYHQDFVKLHPTHPYVMVNSRPKVEKLRKTFPELLKKKAS
jgi:peptide-methionine (S)-S-oxide reductase